MIRWAGHVACVREKIRACGSVMWKSERDISLGREDDIKMCVKEKEIEVVYWIYLA
jgi:hypothetical protein